MHRLFPPVSRPPGTTHHGERTVLQICEQPVEGRTNNAHSVPFQLIAQQRLQRFTSPPGLPKPFPLFGEITQTLVDGPHVSGDNLTNPGTGSSAL